MAVPLLRTCTSARVLACDAFQSLAQCSPTTCFGAGLAAAPHVPVAPAPSSPISTARLALAPAALESTEPCTVQPPTNANLRVFSGIQPSGAGGMTLGNYIGAIKNWVHMQEQGPRDQSLFRCGWCC